ncbi:MAG: DUF1849 family protein [Proteobacteria bacterium]|nr:DUF1849 family protein [Pseudomonadota bacterium]
MRLSVSRASYGFPVRRDVVRASWILLAALTGLGFLAAPSSVQAQAAKPTPGLESPDTDLVPHRVLYTMSLDSSKDGGLAGAKGAMLYRFADACDGWTVETNIYLKLQYDDGRDVKIAWSYASTEAKDGLSYRFRMTHKRNGQVIEALKGSAVLQSPGGAGTATFDQKAAPDADKKPGTVALPKGTMFPTRHLLGLVRAGRIGPRFRADTVFDGASLDNPYKVSATIGRPKAAGKAEAKTLKSLFKTAGLDDSTAWPVRLAFFPVRSRKPTPEFELGVHYRADGIAEKIIQDYGDFSIRMVPAEVERLQRPEC